MHGHPKAGPCKIYDNLSSGLISHSTQWMILIDLNKFDVSTKYHVDQAIEDLNVKD